LRLRLAWIWRKRRNDIFQHRKNGSLPLSIGDERIARNHEERQSLCAFLRRALAVAAPTPTPALDFKALVLLFFLLIGSGSFLAGTKWMRG
jgi:hypothetical protein